MYCKFYIFGVMSTEAGIAQRKLIVIRIYLSKQKLKIFVCYTHSFKVDLKLFSSFLNDNTFFC